MYVTYVLRNVRLHWGIGWPVSLCQHVDAQIQLTNLAVHFARPEVGHDILGYIHILEHALELGRES